MGPKKKNPPNLLRALDSDMYEVSLWMYRIMGDKLLMLLHDESRVNAREAGQEVVLPSLDGSFCCIGTVIAWWDHWRY